MFKVGDIVVLKSGGPAMTVIQVTDTAGTAFAQCVWYTRLRGFEERPFEPHVLKLAVNLEKPDSTGRLWSEHPC